MTAGFVAFASLPCSFALRCELPLDGRRGSAFATGFATLGFAGRALDAHGHKHPEAASRSPLRHPDSDFRCRGTPARSPPCAGPPWARFRLARRRSRRSVPDRDIAGPPHGLCQFQASGLCVVVVWIVATGDRDDPNRELTARSSSAALTVSLMFGSLRALLVGNW